MDASGTTCLGSGVIPLTDDILKESIQSAISQNYVSIGMLLLTLAIAGVIVAYVVLAIYNLFANWRRMTQSGRKQQPMNADSLDDARSVTERARVDLPMMSEVTVAKKQLRDLEAQYRPYNEAMRRHALRRGEMPDDLIDNRIVSRDYDDYDYKKNRRGHKPKGGDRRVITDPNRPLIERGRRRNSDTGSDSEDGH